MMKKSILIAMTLVLGVFATPARAETGPVTLRINGNHDDNAFHISLSPDGRLYEVTTATVALEVGGDTCSHPRQDPTEIVCKAPEIAGFEVNGLGGADFVEFSGNIPVPVTIRGGPGNDRLIGGGASDKLVGGPGADLLVGRRGDDWLMGGPGNDRLLGGPGDDQLRGGPGRDRLVGGPGQNTLVP